jgi:hypothetical protein
VILPLNQAFYDKPSAKKTFKIEAAQALSIVAIGARYPGTALPSPIGSASTAVAKMRVQWATSDAGARQPETRQPRHKFGHFVVSADACL